MTSPGRGIYAGRRAPARIRASHLAALDALARERRIPLPDLLAAALDAGLAALVDHEQVDVETTHKIFAAAASVACGACFLARPVRCAKHRSREDGGHATRVHRHRAV